MSASPAYDFDAGSFRGVFDTDIGRKLWDFMNEGSTIDLMKDASDRGRPAVEPLQEALLEQFEQGRVKENRIKQMIGRMARQVLERSGYRLVSDRNSVKPWRLFSLASTYERRG